MALIQKLPQSDQHVSLAVPFSIRIFKKCIEHKIDFSLVKHLHFYDLQCLIIQFDIQRIEAYFETENRKRLNAQGIKEVKHVSGSEALKFLGR